MLIYNNKEGLEEGLVQLRKDINNVEHPSYYNSGKIEVIDFIEDQNLDFCLGNAVKYISRAGKKDPDKMIEDLEKARWYINHKIASLKLKDET